MSMQDVWEGASGDSWFARLDGRTKLSMLFLFSVLVILIDNPRTLFYLFAFSLTVHIFAGTSLRKWRVLALFVLLALWGSIASQALFFAQNPKTPVATLISPDLPLLGYITGGLFIYREGIIYGAVQGMRSASLLAMGLLLCWSSDPRQLLKGLTAWHLSPQAAFMLVTALRFFPVLAMEAGEVVTALRLRSRTRSGRSGTIRYLPYIIKPLLARCLRRSQTLSLSVVSRGLFLAKGKKGEPWRWQEKYSCAVVLLLCFAVGIGKILYALSEQGLYFGIFRWVYDWNKLYL